MVRSPEPLSAKATSPLFAPQLLLVDLSPGAAPPLYEQLYLGLRDQIVRGHLRQGGRLASTRRLADHLAISRFTVVTALERLLAEGYLEARRGSGTFVTRTLPEHFMRPPAGHAPSPAGADVRAALSRRGTQLSSTHVTGPRPEAPRA